MKILRSHLALVLLCLTTACSTVEPPQGPSVAEAVGTAEAGGTAQVGGTVEAGGTAEAVEATSTGSSASANSRHFRILQINDVYKVEGLEGGTIGGLARVRTLRRQLEADGTPVLLLHGGDVIYPSVMSKYFDAKGMIEVLNLLDGDPDSFDARMFVTFGNHEFDRSEPDILLDRLRESAFSWVSSNVYYRLPEATPQPFLRVVPTVWHTRVVDLDGLRVGIFGLTLDDTNRDYVVYDYGSVAHGEQQLHLQDVAVRSAIATLQDEGAEVIVALTHQEMSEDRRLARAFPEIDVVIGGHEHIHLQAEVDGTSITKADSDARTAWIVDIDASNPDGVRVEPTLRDLDASIAKDPQVQNVVDQWVSRLESKVDNYAKVYGTTVHELLGEESAIRGRETAMGNWLADVMRERMSTDIAFFNGGSVRINDNIPAGGDIRGEHLEGIFYFDGSLVAFDLTGAQLIDVLNNSVSLADSGAGRFLQVSGLRFSYRGSSSADGEAVFEVVEDSVEILDPATGNYRLLDLDASYSCTTSHYLWYRGSESDGYNIFSQHAGGTSPPLTDGELQDLDWREVTEAWLAEHKQVTVDVEGRIVRVAEAEPTAP